MAESKISIIVPVYNLEHYIERTVQSILRQTYRDIELILVNDGSTDKSREIIEALCLSDDRIITINQKNMGVAKARENGVSVASGDWIGFIDGDDLIDPDMYEHLLKNAVETNSDISHCGYQMVFPNRVDYYYNTGRKIIQSREDGVHDLLEGTFVEPGLCIKLYRADIIRNALKLYDMSLDIRINEDLLLNYYCFSLANASVYEDFCPYHYMVRKGSASTSTWNDHKLADPYRVLKILLKHTSDNACLQNILNGRLIAQLIHLSTLSCKKDGEIVRKYRTSARKEIRKMVFQVIKGSFSTKQKIQTIWVAVWPWSYGTVHRMYAMLSGVGRKYKVD